MLMVVTHMDRVIALSLGEDTRALIDRARAFFFSRAEIIRAAIMYHFIHPCERPREPGRRGTNAKLPGEMLARVDEEAARLGVSRSEFVDQAVNNYLTQLLPKLFSEEVCEEQERAEVIVFAGGERIILRPLPAHKRGGARNQ